ncbi:hypothetical protein PoB_002389800 [Plakobranchus ocellatus]|uniref:Uncharacterized protein n=1 Tax=Plakobranchus ocellatus TaxID=259542 RepID=A0AAV3ZSA0_9GAST|nr:hypothetical protein PoB_002389800 [Plakobranchus ocellatus]
MEALILSDSFSLPSSPEVYSLHAWTDTCALPQLVTDCSMELPEIGCHTSQAGSLMLTAPRHTLGIDVGSFFL